MISGGCSLSLPVATYGRLTTEQKTASSNPSRRDNEARQDVGAKHGSRQVSGAAELSELYSRSLIFGLARLGHDPLLPFSELLIYV